MKLRKFKWDDLYAVQALINLIAEDESDPFFYNLEWLHFVLNQAGVDAERNCFIATVYEGRIVGYSRIESSENPSQRKVFAGTHPNFRNIGVGRALIALSDFNLQTIHPPNTPLNIIRRSSSHNPSANHILTEKGYQQTGSDGNDKLLWKRQLQ